MKLASDNFARDGLMPRAHGGRESDSSQPLRLSVLTATPTCIDQIQHYHGRRNFELLAGVSLPPTPAPCFSFWRWIY